MFVPKKILVIATRQIGDVLITTPLIHRAREIWPKATIDVLGYDNTMGMLEGNPDINYVIESPEHPNWSEYKSLIKKIFRRYDFAIISQPSDRAHVYGFLAAPRRIGIIPQKTSHNWWKRLLCQHTIMLDYMHKHVVRERFELLDSYDCAQNRTPAIVVPRTVNHFTAVKEVANSPYLVIHATPMWRFKRWAAAQWAETISFFVKHGYHVVLTGSASTQDRNLNNEILNHLPIQIQSQIKDQSGKLSLAQTCQLLQKAAGYIGVDTSITHLAAACGIPTIALFGATPPTNYGPWPNGFSGKQPWSLVGPGNSNSARMQVQSNVMIIQGPGACVPCRKSGCLNRFESHSDCLDWLSSQDVIDYARAHLKVT